MAEKKNEVAKTQKQEMTMSDYFTSELNRISGALPAKFNKQRFALNFISMCNEKGLQKFKKEDLATALVRSAQDGLDPLNNEVYIHEGYGGKLQYDISYKGLRKMAIEKSQKPISNIYAQLIKEGDELDELIINGVPSLNYKSKFNNKGSIIGVFAICNYQDGTMIYEVMTKEEIDACRSKSKNSGAWKDFYGEMAKKSVIRRLSKNITLSWDNQEQADAFTGADEFITDPKEQAAQDIEQNANQQNLDDDVVVEVDPNEIEGQMSMFEERSNT